MGVWIEIEEFNEMKSQTAVTPCVGVWIEIDILGDESDASKVTPCVGQWECGLKYWLYTDIQVYIWSLPAWECGLKYLS